MKKYDRLTEDITTFIETLLPTCKSATGLASEIGFDVSGLIKHIKKYRNMIETELVNKFGKKYHCPHNQDICLNCFREAKNLTKCTCSSCKIMCNQVCNDFTKVPDCDRIRKFPYVCNGCENLKSCRLNRYYYQANNVWKQITETRPLARKGTHFKDEFFVTLSNLLTPLIKEKHQSLPQIMLKHKEEIRCSYVSLLKFIDLGLIPNIKNIDLTKRVRYPKKYKKEASEPTNLAFIKNRTYDDFVEFLTNNPLIDLVEMDTVLSSRDGSKCLLTLLFRKSNYMMVFLMKRKTNEEVAKVFSFLRQKLGIELFKKTFPCILTDNGSEFYDPRVIEFDPESEEKISHVFYCNPGKSGQKGKIEKNHVKLRKIFPKPTNFDNFTQKQINIALSHVNSEPRAILNRNCPGLIAKLWLNEKVLATTEYNFIEPDLVYLSPNLLK